MSKIKLGGWRIEVGPGRALARQVHGNTIIAAREIIPGKTEADGVFINEPNVTASIGFADCMPLVLAGQESAVILHVSRKTLVAGLLDNVPNVLHPKEIEHVWIGPHICAKHFTFEWAGKGIAAFKQRFPAAVYEEGNLMHLSLQTAAQGYFNDWGILADVITEDGRCTYEASGLPSWKRYRQQGGTADTLATYTASLWQL